MSRIRLFLHRTPFHAASQTRNSTRRIPHHHPSLPLPLESRFRWSYLWYAAVLGLGVTTGLGARQFAAPLGLPEPGSKSDKLILESLGKDIDKLEIVQSLRSQSYNLHSDTALKTDAGLGAAGAKKISAYKGWLEVDINFTGTDEGKNGILGVMSGTRGLGVQRAFWNAETREMIAVVWMGGGLSGWPGVAHGGAIATVFEEIMARMRRGPEGPVEPVHRPDSLSVTYAKPTYALDFYILRASFSKPNRGQTEPVPEPESQPTKGWLSWLSPAKDLTKTNQVAKLDEEIIGTLESVKGDLCVRAKGAFGEH